MISNYDITTKIVKIKIQIVVLFIKESMNSNFILL